MSSPCHLDTELDTLRTSFKKLGYPDYYIKGALSNARTKFISGPTVREFSRDRKIPIFVPYDPYFVSLKQFLYKSAYELIFTYRNNTRNLVVRRRESGGGPLQPSGVYHVPCTCADCSMDYYGRTSKPYDVRMGEHMKDIRNLNCNNSMVKHMLENPGHGFNLDSAEILWKTRNVTEQKMVEAACISELPNCNTSKGEIPVNSILSSLIMRLTDIPRFIAGTDHGNSPSHSSLHPLPRVPQPPRPVQPSASQPLPSSSQLHTFSPPPAASLTQPSLASAFSPSQPPRTSVTNRVSSLNRPPDLQPGTPPIARRLRSSQRNATIS